MLQPMAPFCEPWGLAGSLRGVDRRRPGSARARRVIQVHDLYAGRGREQAPGTRRAVGPPDRGRPRIPWFRPGNLTRQAVPKARVAGRGGGGTHIERSDCLGCQGGLVYF